MSYNIENGMWRSVFAVPSDIVDVHLKLLGEVPLKVFLVLLRYNGGLDAAALSEVVGKPIGVIREALEYLTSEGLLKSLDSDRVKPQLKYVETRPAPKPEPGGTTRDRVTTISTERRRFERDEINILAENDENITWLLQESQSVLGKTLSAVATDTIVALYSYYGMKPDVIMMVLQYCVSIEKANMRYIEKVAASWIENGIETHEQAEAEIRRKMQSKTVESRIKSAFGIYDRNLVSSEKKYIDAWTTEFGFDVPMIALAFEKCVESKAKLSFSYINGILTNWHTKGVTTPAQAMKESKEGAPKKSSQKTEVKSASYDISEVEELLKQGAF